MKSMMNYVTYAKDTKKLHFAPSKELLMVNSRMLRSQSAYGGSMQQHGGERELARTLGLLVPMADQAGTPPPASSYFDSLETLKVASKKGI